MGFSRGCRDFLDFDGEDLAVGEELVRRRDFLGEAAVAGGGAEVEVEVDGGVEEEGIGGGQATLLEFDVGFLEIMGEGDSWTGGGA